jgi:ERCC4-related helicase
MGRLCIATPQLTANDLQRGALTLDAVGLVIIDEGHHAARTHASIAVANAAHARGIRILALTASPGGDLERIERIRKNLHLDRWVRIPEDATQAFRPPVMERREFISIANAARPIIEQLSDVLARLTAVLVEHNYLEGPSRSPSPADLARAHDQLRKQERWTIVPYAAAAQQLTAVLSLVVSDAYGTALESLARALEKRDANDRLTRTARRLMSTPEIRRVREALEVLVRDGVRHPKQEAAIRTIRAMQRDAGRPIRILVFNRYAAGVLQLTDILHRELGIRVEPAIGKSRMRAEALIATLHAFGRGDVPIVVGTDVIREGIHVPEIDLLVVYSPPRNERELIQLTGRVGRTHPGEIISLIADHDVDRRYVSSAAVKAQRMRGVLQPNAQPRGSDGATHRSMFAANPHKPREAFVRALAGRFVCERFIVVRASVEEGRNHKSYVRMLVGDRTGTVPLYHWCPRGRTQADALVQAHPSGTVLIVAGTYEESRSPRIVVNPRERQSITRCPDGDYDPADFDRTPPF